MTTTAMDWLNSVLLANRKNVWGGCPLVYCNQEVCCCTIVERLPFTNVKANVLQWSNARWHSFADCYSLMSIVWKNAEFFAQKKSVALPTLLLAQKTSAKAKQLSENAESDRNVQRQEQPQQEQPQQSKEQQQQQPKEQQQLQQNKQQQQRHQEKQQKPEQPIEEKIKEPIEEQSQDKAHCQKQQQQQHRQRQQGQKLHQKPKQKTEVSNKDKQKRADCETSENWRARTTISVTDKPLMQVGPRRWQRRRRKKAASNGAQAVTSK